MGTDLGTCIAAIAPVTGIIVGALTCRECQPYRWDDEGRWIVHEYADARPVTMRWGLHMDLFSHDDLKAGDVNCRYTAMVEDETEDRCAPLMRYGLSGVEELFLLNPVLRGDCSNIKYNTPYCTDGCKLKYCFPVLHIPTIRNLIAGRRRLTRHASFGAPASVRWLLRPSAQQRNLSWC